MSSNFSGSSARPTFTPSGSSAGPAVEGGVAGAVLLVVLAISSLFLLQGDDNQRILLAICIGTVLYALLLLSPATGVCSAMVFLGILGGLKRWLIPVLGYSSFDPLMLVAPTVTGIYFLERVIRRQIPMDTPISKLILALFLFMILETVNPLQGGIMIGVAGAIFYMIPVFWYYLGRSVGTLRLMRSTVACAMVISVFGSLYGNYQQWFGFLESEKMWMRSVNWVLGISGNAVKVFSFFCSPAEYASFFQIGLVLSFIGVLRKRPISAVMLIAFAVGLFFTGNRGPVLLSLAGCAIVWAIQKPNPRAWLPRLVAAVAFAIFALMFSLSHLNVGDVKNSAAHDLAEHQVEGLLNPLGKDRNAGGHLNLVGGGILYGFTHPLGSGLGVTSMGGKMGAGQFAGDSDSGFGTEADVSNFFVSCGFLGGMVYIALMYYIARSLLMRWQQTRDDTYLSLIGALACQPGLWMMGTHYCSMVLFWVCIGALDRMDSVDLARKRTALKEGQAEPSPSRTSSRWAPVPADVRASRPGIGGI